MGLDIGNDFFISFIKSLQDNDVRYMLIGGYALNFHGVNRTTTDMDIWLAPDNNNKKNFYKALLQIGYAEDEVGEILEDDFTQHQGYTFGPMPDHVDVLTIIHHSLSFDEAEKTLLQHPIGDNIFLKVVNNDYLREMKIRSHRLKDWSDVEQLDKLKKLDQNKKKKE